MFSWAQRAHGIVQSAAAVVAAAATLLTCGGSPAAAAERTYSHGSMLSPLQQAPRPTAVRAQRSWVDARYAHVLATGAQAVVYLSQFKYGTVLVYPTGTSTPPSSPIETITGLAGPGGLAVDSSGNLYVAEQSANDIKVFAPGSTTPSKTLSAPASGSIRNIAVDGRGTAYVTFATFQNAGELLVYPKGATTPSSVLSDPSIQYVEFVAVDAIGNVIVTYISSGIVHIGAFAAFTSLGMSLGIPFFHELNVDRVSASNPSAVPFDIAFDKHGNLLASDNGANSQLIGMYPPTVQTASNSLRVGDPAGHYLGFNLFALTGGNHHLLVAPEGSGFLYQYAYPSGAPEQTIVLPVTSVDGIATSPSSPVGSW